MSSKAMSVEENIAVARRWNEEGVNGRRFDLIDELFHPNYTQRSGMDGPWSIVVQGREAAKAGFSQFFQDHPEIKVVIDDIFGVGDKVVIRFSWYDDEGKFFGMSITIYRMVDGLILDNWVSATTVQT